MLKEISQSLKAKLYERVTDPFLSSYTIAYIVFNWQAGLILISALPPKDKIREIIPLISQCKSYLVPLAIAVFYSLVYPWIKLGLLKLHYLADTRLINLKKTHFNNEILTIEESTQLKRELTERNDNLAAAQTFYKTHYKTIARFLISEVMKPNPKLEEARRQSNGEADEYEILMIKDGETIPLFHMVSDLDGFAVKSIPEHKTIVGIVVKVLLDKYAIVQKNGLLNININAAESTQLMLSMDVPGGLTQVVPTEKRTPRIIFGSFLPNNIFRIRWQTVTKTTT